MINDLNLIGIPNRQIYNNDKIAKYKLANEQEKFVSDKLNICSQKYIWMPTAEWASTNNSEYNRCLGDIVGIDKTTYKLSACIDLKVQEFGKNEPNFVGTITLNSYFGFGYNFSNHYYLCCNEFGKNIILVNSNFIDNLIKRRIQFIYQSKFDRTKYEVNIYDWIKKYYYINTEFVAKEDYIPSKFIIPYNILKK